MDLANFDAGTWTAAFGFLTALFGAFAAIIKLAEKAVGRINEKRGNIRASIVRLQAKYDESRLAKVDEALKSMQLLVESHQGQITELRAAQSDIKDAQEHLNRSYKEMPRLMTEVVQYVQQSQTKVEEFSKQRQELVEDVAKIKTVIMDRGGDWKFVTTQKKPGQ